MSNHTLHCEEENRKISLIKVDPMRHLFGFTMKMYYAFLNYTL